MREDELDEFLGKKKLPGFFDSMLKEFPIMRAEGKIFRNPLIDIIDEKNCFKIVAELPGLDKKDIELDAAEDYLTIKAVSKKEEKAEGKNFYRQERSIQQFYRKIPLSEKIIPSKVTAEYKNGILEVTLQKQVKAKRIGRKIDAK